MPIDPGNVIWLAQDAPLADAEAVIRAVYTADSQRYTTVTQMLGAGAFVILVGLGNILVQGQPDRTLQGTALVAAWTAVVLAAVSAVGAVWFAWRAAHTHDDLVVALELYAAVR